VEAGGGGEEGEDGDGLGSTKELGLLCGFGCLHSAGKEDTGSLFSSCMIAVSWCLEVFTRAPGSPCMQSTSLGDCV